MRGCGFLRVSDEKQPGYSEKFRPLFEADNDDFLLTLFNLNYLDEENVTQDDFGIRIEVLIKENANITTDEMAEKLGVSARTIRRHIKAMQNVKYVGSGYSGHAGNVKNGRCICYAWRYE